MVFNVGDKYLILGYKGTGKTELGEYIMKLTNKDYTYVDLNSEESLRKLDKDGSYILDNYSCGDSSMDLKLNDKSTLIVISPYALSVPPHKRLLFDYVLIPNIKTSQNNYATKMVHKNFVNTTTYDDFKKINDTLGIGDFSIFKDQENVGMINSRNDSRSILSTIFSYFTFWV